MPYYPAVGRCTIPILTCCEKHLTYDLSYMAHGMGYFTVFNECIFPEMSKVSPRITIWGSDLKASKDENIHFFPFLAVVSFVIQLLGNFTMHLN